MGMIQELRGIRPVRNVQAGQWLEDFLVAAVAAILVIRVYLELTGYPQVGGKGLHIAHMLWGGLFMLVAIVLLVAFLGRDVVRLGAILGGLGFGVFIDELGKFITSDNNYFFRPTFALIYVIFIVLFLTFRWIDRRRTPTEQEALVNAVNILIEVVRHDLDAHEKEEALALLRRSDPSNPIVAPLTRLLEEATPLPATKPPLPVRIARAAHAFYRRVIGFSWFARALITLFIVIAVGDVIGLISTIVRDPSFGLGSPDISFVEGADTIASGVFAGMILAGITQLRRSRLTAYRWFRRAMLVAIFFGQVFSFYSEQLLAVIGLTVNLLLLGALTYTIRDEEEEIAARPPPVMPTGVMRDT